MATREIKIGLMSFIRADSPSDTILWGFGLMGAEVDVHESDLARFDRLNGASASAQPPLVSLGEQADGDSDEPPRSGRGSGLEAWTEYARGLGYEVEDDATRDDVIALVDSNK